MVGHTYVGGTLFTVLQSRISGEGTAVLVHIFFSFIYFS